MQKSSVLTPSNKSSSGVATAAIATNDKENESISNQLTKARRTSKPKTGLASKQTVEEIWKERAHTLADIVYDLEIQKRKLQRRLKAAQEQLQQQSTIDEDANANTDDNNTELDELKRALQQGTKQHAVAVEHKNSNNDNDELRVLREDNAAKEKELLHALDLLQQAQMREEELRRQAINLSSQMKLLRDALEDSNGNVEILEQEIEEIEELVFESQSILQTPMNGCCNHVDSDDDVDSSSKYSGLERKSKSTGGHALRSFALSVLVVRCIVAGMAFVSSQSRNG